MNISKLLQTVALTMILGACATTAPAPDYQALLAAPDRSEADRATDKRRDPLDLLKFYDLRPGMTVADLGAIGGYNTELLARAVAPGGKVYAQNDRAYASRIAERMKAPAMKNVIAVARNFDDPLPPEARNLDAVVFNFFYHDTVNMPVDRAKMNRAVFNALKKGGVYIVADHSARPGAGTADTKTLHRIEDATLRREVEAAGFQLAAEGLFLRNPQDPRTGPVFKSPIPNDEFVYKFVKP